MKFLAAAIAVASTITTVHAIHVTNSTYFKGFNVAATNTDGSCKNVTHWAATFKQLQTLPGSFNSARLFSSADCGALASAVPAALATNSTIFVGVWAQNATKFGSEKAALLEVIQMYGGAWIAAIGVGSEDLFRHELEPEALAQQVYDVRGMVRQFGINAPVGHVDDWTAWTNTSNAAVITASDFVGTDYYPYFETTPIAHANKTFWASLAAVKASVEKVKNGTQVWLTETGWPVAGPTLGKAEASVDNAKYYWKSVACKAFEGMNTFWYSIEDHNITSPVEFGLVAQGKNHYVAAC